MQVDQELLFDIAAEASSILTRKIIQATDERTLRITLNEYNLIDLLREQENSFTYPNGNIHIFGESNVKEHVIYQIFKNQGIDKDRVKLHLGFNEYKKINFKRLVIDQKIDLFYLVQFHTQLVIKGITRVLLI
ncbi:hypothetical protein [Terribacillus aidingensis]|uniref:hypothetical protein n=1 Tax=Terribacillus aidingensis TaxID=586416 RepID=UPI00344C0642